MRDGEPPQSGTDDQLFLIPEADDDDPARDEASGELGSLASRIQEDLDVVRALPRQLSRTLGAIREVVSEIAAAQEAIGGEIGALRVQQEEDRTAIAAAVERLGGGEAVDGRHEERDREKLATAIEGLRERIVTGLTQGFERLQEGVTGAIDRAGEEGRETLPAAVAEQVAGTVTAEIRAALADAGAAWSGEEGLRALREMVAAQQDMEKAARSMSAELDRIRKRIEAWGRARSSPRLADEVGALEERVVALEGAIERRLVEEVSERLSRVFDRRFEALVQLLDARMTPPAALEDEDDRRGLFRRR